ncbi:MAG: nucleotidyltransferase domain-containing protein [Prevotellaceae bacterium]|jgi:predicted nucleotidyltransferase|nr:nucleotidyltransferase domain-containing protein [Prevotellaceae bacterium]
MDKREAIVEKARAYKDLVSKSFPVAFEKCYLFGSYAKGTPHEHSDIDIALVVDHLNERYSILDTEPLLWKIARRIDIRISPVVIARDTDYAGFLSEIQRTGVEV